MNEDRFTAIMPYIVTDLISMIMEKMKLSADEAINKLYSSELYALLEDEETKVWHYSTDMLFVLFEQELSTGKIEFPDI